MKGGNREDLFGNPGGNFGTSNGNNGGGVLSKRELAYEDKRRKMMGGAGPASGVTTIDLYAGNN